MKKFYHLRFAILFTVFSFIQSNAQVNLPYTLHFSNNDASNWSDGIAQDGDGGTQKINGLDIQIFAATSSFTLLPGSTIIWHDNSYLSSADAGYTGITPGPDVTVTSNGIPAMVIKSSNTANNFSLTSITMYDWGGSSPVTIAGYNNGSLIGSVNVSFDDINFTTKTVTQADELTPAFFQNVDEVRFYPTSSSVFWLSFNDVALAATGTLPVQLVSFNARLINDNSVLLQWKTAQEKNSDHFDIEHSTDGISFVKIGQIQAKGTSNELTDYSFTCTNVMAGKHFYRLKQVDVDGKFEYSQIVIVTVDVNNTISIYPNPVKDHLEINSPGTTIQEISIFNAVGILMQKKSLHAQTGTIYLTDYPKGIYFIEMTTASGKSLHSIFKE